MRVLSPVFVDVLAVVGVVVLAAIGRVSGDLALGTLLAILAGRMVPVTGKPGLRDDRDESSANGPPTGNGPMRKTYADGIPSGVLTLLQFPKTALAALIHH